MTASESNISAEQAMLILIKPQFNLTYIMMVAEAHVLKIVTIPSIYQDCGSTGWPSSETLLNSLIWYEINYDAFLFLRISFDRSFYTLIIFEEYLHCYVVLVFWSSISFTISRLFSQLWFLSILPCYLVFLRSNIHLS